MTRGPSRLASGLIVLLIATSSIIGVVGAASSPISANVERAETNADYDLNDLQRGGTRVPEIHDGWRPIEGSTAAAWLQYYPTGGWVDDSRGSDQWRYLGSGDTVKRNYVVLTVMRLGDVESREATLNVVYYDKEKRTRQVGNTTDTYPVAANQTVEKVSVKLNGRGTRVRVPLRPHYDSTKQVTMWLEESPDDTRWRFEHHSLKSTQSSTVDTAGDLAVAVGKVVVIGAALVLVFGVVARMLNRIALVGPMKGLMWWALVIGAIQLFGALAAWDIVSNVISTHPEVLALELGLVGLIQGIEARGRGETMKAIAIRPDIEPAQTATGEQGVSSNGLGFGDARVVTDEDGRHVLVKPGIGRWLIRIMGGRQYLEGTDEIRCSVDITDGEPELAYYVDPLSENVIERESPSFALDLPNPSLTQLGIVAGGTYLAGVTTEAIGLGWMVGIAGVGLLAIPAFVTANAPNAIIEPAPAQMGEAHANSMVLAAQYDAVRTVEEAQDAIVREQAKRNVAAERADEERATTLVEETLGADEDTGTVRDVVDVVDDLGERLEKFRNPDATDDSEVMPSDD